MKKAVGIGIGSFFVFLIGNIMLGNIVGLVIPGGDSMANSYFYPLYTAVTMLISIVISSAYLILKKLEGIVDKKDEK